MGKVGTLGRESEYKSIVGKLMWLFKTRYDLRFSIGLLTRSLLSAGDDHITRAMRVVKYISGNPERKLVIDGTVPMTVSAGSDSDWGGDFKESKSTSVFFIKIGKYHNFNERLPIRWPWQKHWL